MMITTQHEKDHCHTQYSLFTVDRRQRQVKVKLFIIQQPQHRQLYIIHNGNEQMMQMDNLTITL